MIERRVRSTRRRDDAADLPRVPQENRTIGRTFTGNAGQVYRPSMFVTLTLPSYGRITPGTGTPVDPDTYDYRRAALDAIHLPRCSRAGCRTSAAAPATRPSTSPRSNPRSGWLRTSTSRSGVRSPGRCCGT